MYWIVVVLPLFFFGCSDFFSRPEAPPSIDEKPIEDPNIEPSDKPTGLTECENLQSFSEENLLKNMALCVLRPMLEELADESALLTRRLKESGNSDESRVQWKIAANAYNRVSVGQVGPLKSGDDLISSFPNFNRCMVDQNVVHYKKFGELKYKSEFQVQGLLAIEYLLFETSLGSRCSVRRFPEIASWTKLTKKEKQQDRLAVAIVVSELMNGHLNSIQSEWREGFEMAYVKLGKKSINELTDSLVVALEEIKNQKLGIPLGLHLDCSDGDFCPEDREHRYANTSLDAIENQLIGFKEIFEGHSAGEWGIDDMLEAAGHKSISDMLVSDTLQALDSVAAVKKEGSLKEHLEKIDYSSCQQTTLENREIAVCALFHDVKKMINTMKARVLVALSLIAPPSYQGDGDGGKP